MRYYVTLTTKYGNVLTMAIRDAETLDSTLRWIERLRHYQCDDPVIYWVTLEGKHWCLAPAELVGEVQVEEQPLEAATS